MGETRDKHSEPETAVPGDPHGSESAQRSRSGVFGRPSSKPPGRPGRRLRKRIGKEPGHFRGAEGGPSPGGVEGGADRSSGSGKASLFRRRVAKKKKRTKRAVTPTTSPTHHGRTVVDDIELDPWPAAITGNVVLPVAVWLPASVTVTLRWKSPATVGSQNRLAEFALVQLEGRPEYSNEFGATPPVATVARVVDELTTTETGDAVKGAVRVAPEGSTSRTVELEAGFPSASVTRTFGE